MRSFQDIISAWPSRSTLAADLDVTAQVVSNMYSRNSIAARYWATLVAAAAEREIKGVSFEALANAAGVDRGRNPDLDLDEPSVASRASVTPQSPSGLVGQRSGGA